MSRYLEMGKTSNSEHDLHAAARAGDLVTVQTIITTNPLSVNSRDKHSRTPLHLAAWAGQTRIVEILCKNKADISAAAMDDMGAIHFAAQKGHLEVVQTLVLSGISVKSTNRKGMTPLHYAVQGCYLDLIQYLVKKGANIRIKNKVGKSPLDLATTEEMRSLLSCPVDLKETDKAENYQTRTKVSENEYDRKLKYESYKRKTEDDQPKKKASENEEDEKPKDKTNKRKTGDEVIVETKKKKVALNHLLTSDDTQEEDD